jgi:hypothetical protein
MKPKLPIMLAILAGTTGAAFGLGPGVSPP